MRTPRIAITADLHWGIPRCQAPNLSLIKDLQLNPPDLLILAGDQGADTHYGECLDQFKNLGCPVAVVPGNHDIWVREEDTRGNSLDVYETHLPRETTQRGFHLLDQGPLLLPQFDLAIVGSMNWYDYSWAASELDARFPKEKWRLEKMCFSRGKHNDQKFVRWPEGTDNISFTRMLSQRLKDHLEVAKTRAGQVVLVTHHPALPELGFPPSGRQDPTLNPEDLPSMDHLLWEAFSGNLMVEKLVRANADHLSLVVSGHTHRWRSGQLGNARLVNVGSDYPVKNLIRLEGLGGSMEVEQFGPEV